MVNIDDFIKRLEIILDYYNLSASAFADKINVQRSSLSHLLSGRNKPSLDFIIKVIEVFPEVDLYWILNGKGNFPKSEIVAQSVIEIEKDTSSLPIVDIPNSELDLFSTVEKGIPPTLSESNTVESIKTENNSPEEIERIVVFFKNGTFKNYKP
ncbi:helix-turn-helix domain-containing protein [Flavobacterium lacisediminis]|uniref:Helix-turn-helix domain-containing protein n=1 Tax=Flavobacterium lacisediminis TaxID=2989705 RepID=A0ABT3EJA9_9FLAO|nr:helix-turn-helix transcriptional regulator [Flavobacterium lacisediminis]MCW1148645.1 helix-turn-helix domain-containing protein [Flavobacterium lacisediminis]